MGDISTSWSTAGTYGDWVLSGSDLQSGNEIITSVLISIFTDRLANEDDVIQDGNDPRGWIGDLGSDVLIGSRLWLLRRAKLTRATAQKAKDMARESLQWMIDDGAVVKFDIETEIILPNRLDMKVTAYKRDGIKVVMNFTNSWNVSAARTLSASPMAAEVGTLQMVDSLEMIDTLEMF